MRLTPLRLILGYAGRWQLSTFNTFVSTLLAHCNPNGRCVADYVQVYQLWNEWNLCVHWSGNAVQLYQMIQYPALLIRQTVANAIITAPSPTPAPANCQSGNYQTDLTTWLNLENTNGRISDMVDWHVLDCYRFDYEYARGTMGQV